MSSSLICRYKSLLLEISPRVWVVKTHLLHFLFFCFQLNALAFLQVVDHVSVTNLEQVWLNLAVFKLSRYVTAPASVNSATFVIRFTFSSLLYNKFVINFYST